MRVCAVSARLGWVSRRPGRLRSCPALRALAARSGLDSAHRALLRAGCHVCAKTQFWLVCAWLPAASAGAGGCRLGGRLQHALGSATLSGCRLCPVGRLCPTVGFVGLPALSGCLTWLSLSTRISRGSSKCRCRIATSFVVGSVGFCRVGRSSEIPLGNILQPTSKTPKTAQRILQGPT